VNERSFPEDSRYLRAKRGTQPNLYSKNQLHLYNWSVKPKEFSGASGKIGGGLLAMIISSASIFH
jgi:hypothetical protein